MLRYFQPTYSKMLPVPRVTGKRISVYISVVFPSCGCTSRSELKSHHPEVPDGVLMDAAAPGDGEAVPLWKQIGFGMLGDVFCEWIGGSCPNQSMPFCRLISCDITF